MKTTVNAARRTLVLPLVAACLALAATHAAAFPTYPNFAPVATSPNQAAVAAALDQVPSIGGIGAPAQALTPTVLKIQALPAAQQQAIFSQMSARSYGGLFPGAAGPSAALQTGAISNRMAALRANEGSVAGDAPASPVYLADGIGETSPGLLSNPPHGPFSSTSGRWGFFGDAVGVAGRQWGDGNGSGYDFNGEGGTVGADYRVSDGVAVGVSGGLLHSHVSADQGGGTVDGRSYKYGAYATAKTGSWYAETYLGGGVDYFTAERSISGLGLEAGSNPQAHELNFKLDGGYDVKRGRMIYTPFAGLTYDRMNVSDFTENGAGPSDLAVNSFSQKSTKGQLGLRVACGGDGRVHPYFSAAYQHQFEGRGETLISQFTGGGSAFATTLATPGREAALVSAGLDAKLSRNVTAHLSYDGDYRAQYMSHSANVAARLSF